MYQYHEHNKLHQITNIINLLKDQKEIALVTDAGTPCISDPGFELVNEVLKAGIKVIGIPGASSIVTGASISGLDMRRMAYEGFLPKKKGRHTLFNKIEGRRKNYRNFRISQQNFKNFKGCKGISGRTICCNNKGTY